MKELLQKGCLCDNCNAVCAAILLPKIYSGDYELKIPFQNYLNKFCNSLAYLYLCIKH